MKRWIGRWLFLVATVHTIGGIDWFWDDLVGIARAGIVGSVNVESEYLATYFFMLWGFTCYVLAFAIDELERRKITPFPKTLAYSLAGFTVVSIIVAPSSGFWTLIPPSIGLIYRSIGRQQAT